MSLFLVLKNTKKKSKEIIKTIVATRCSHYIQPEEQSLSIILQLSLAVIIQEKNNKINLLNLSLSHSIMTIRCGMQNSHITLSFCQFFITIGSESGRICCSLIAGLSNLSDLLYSTYPPTFSTKKTKEI